MHRFLPELEVHYTKMNYKQLKVVIKEAKEAEHKAIQLRDTLVLLKASERLNRAYAALRILDKGTT